MNGCEQTEQIESLLLKGEEEVVFRHVATCCDCRKFALERGLFPAGCEEPLLGHGVRLYIDLLLCDGQTEEEVPLHFNPKELRAHLKRCACCRLEVDEAGKTPIPVVPKQIVEAAPAKVSDDWSWIDKQQDQPKVELSDIPYLVGVRARRAPVMLESKTDERLPVLMHQRDLNYWFHGLFELSDAKIVLSVRQLVIVKKHMQLVTDSKTTSGFGLWLLGVLDTLETTGVLALDPKTQIDANLSDMIERRLDAEFKRVVAQEPRTPESAAP